MLRSAAPRRPASSALAVAARIRGTTARRIFPPWPTFSHKSPPDRRIRGVGGCVKSAQSVFSCYDNDLQTIAHPGKRTVQPVITYLAPSMKVSHQLTCCSLQRFYNNCEKIEGDRRFFWPTNGRPCVAKRRPDGVLVRRIGLALDGSPASRAPCVPSAPQCRRCGRHARLDTLSGIRQVRPPRQTRDDMTGRRDDRRSRMGTPSAARAAGRGDAWHSACRAVR